jgi:hypothetical protein
LVKYAIVVSFRNFLHAKSEFDSEVKLDIKSFIDSCQVSINLEKNESFLKIVLEIFKTILEKRDCNEMISDNIIISVVRLLFYIYDKEILANVLLILDRCQHRLKELSNEMSLEDVLTLEKKIQSKWCLW